MNGIGNAGEEGVEGKGERKGIPFQENRREGGRRSGNAGIESEGEFYEVGKAVGIEIIGGSGERWGTGAEWRGQLRHHPVEHPPWELRAGRLVELDDTAVTACGLSAPVGEPLVRVAEPLDARFGRPVRV